MTTLSNHKMADLTAILTTIFEETTHTDYTELCWSLYGKREFIEYFGDNHSTLIDELRGIEDGYVIVAPYLTEEQRAVVSKYFTFCYELYTILERLTAMREEWNEFIRELIAIDAPLGSEEECWWGEEGMVFATTDELIDEGGRVERDDIEGFLEETRATARLLNGYVGTSSCGEFERDEYSRAGRNNAVEDRLLTEFNTHIAEFIDLIDRQGGNYMGLNNKIIMIMEIARLCVHTGIQMRHG